jgi:hypothetical protein
MEDIIRTDESLARMRPLLADLSYASPGVALLRRCEVEGGQERRGQVAQLKSLANELVTLVKEKGEGSEERRGQVAQLLKSLANELVARLNLPKSDRRKAARELLEAVAQEAGVPDEALLKLLEADDGPGNS